MDNGGPWRSKYHSIKNVAEALGKDGYFTSCQLSERCSHSAHQPMKWEVFLAGCFGRETGRESHSVIASLLAACVNAEKSFMDDLFADVSFGGIRCSRGLQD